MICSNSLTPLSVEMSPILARAIREPSRMSLARSSSRTFLRAGTTLLRISSWEGRRLSFASPFSPKPRKKSSLLVTVPVS